MDAPITPEHARSMRWVIQLLFLLGIGRVFWLLLFKNHQEGSKKIPALHDSREFVS